MGADSNIFRRDRIIWAAQIRCDFLYCIDNEIFRRPFEHSKIKYRHFTNVVDLSKNGCFNGSNVTEREAFE